jgi:hypothetical protein
LALGATLAAGVDGLISATDGTARCVGSESADSVEATVSADTVEVGLVKDALLSSGVESDPRFATAVVFADASAATLALDVMVPSEAITVVLAPPLACTFASGAAKDDGSGAASGSAPGVLVGVASTAAVSSTVAVSAAFVSDVEFGWAPVDSDPVLDSVDPVVSGAATATHGAVTTAAPIPSATASAPTRPT